MSAPLFSVVIPTYNRAALLARTLESAWAQRFTDFEVIVVDDGSTDGTLEFLKSLGRRVQVLQQGNRGPGAARNLGVKAAKGNYIAFLDSDDVWFPWTLETYATLIAQQGSPAFVAGKPFRFQRKELLAGVSADAVSSERFADYFVSGNEWRWWGVSSFVIRADAFRAAGGFAETNMNGEDGDLALKLGEAAGFVQVTAPFTFGYLEHGGNVTGDLSKTLEGVWHKVRAEKSGNYPGGAARAMERRVIITRHARPVALDCLRRGRRADGWRLYREMFGWHLRMGRLKFLVGFILKSFLP